MMKDKTVRAADVMDQLDRIIENVKAAGGVRDDQLDMIRAVTRNAIDLAPAAGAEPEVWNKNYGWISADNPPKVSGDYWVTVDDRVLPEEEMMPIWNSRLAVPGCYYCGHWTWNTGIAEYDITLFVRAWMPGPEPAKEG